MKFYFECKYKFGDVHAEDEKKATEKVKGKTWCNGGRCDEKCKLKLKSQK